MVAILGAILGILFIFFGVYLWFNLTPISRSLEAIYEDNKKSYDKKYKNSSLVVKTLAFLIIRNENYYHGETQTRYVLLFISPCLVILGISITLLSIGAI